MNLRPTVLVALLPTLASCTIVNETSDGGSDSGTMAEGGLDTGTGIDAGTGVDSGPGADAGTGADSAKPADSGTDGQAGPLGFTPSNIDLNGLDLSKASDVVISGANNGILDTESLSWSCCSIGQQYVAKTITFPDQTKMSVFVVKSLRVEASAVLDVTGHLPLAIVSLGTITLFGNVKVRTGEGGGAFNAMSTSKGTGPGGGLSGPASMLAAGGGASFCGIGGVGSVETGGTPYGKAATYGTPELVPLIAGSAGGAGAISGSNSGGGAIQLVAATSIDVKAGAFISAPGGGGGQGGLASTQEGSGGGSGGAILLEAPTVTIAGALAVNGGGGGSGGYNGGRNGDDGHDSDTTPAKGGTPTETDGGLSTTDHGGNGGAGATQDGTDGINSMSSGAGGGGGAGRIRINTMTGQATLTSATLSPSATTSCLTQGMLK
jgi:hypothetical protein